MRFSIAFFFILFGVKSIAATIHAASAARDDVATAIARAVTGDTVTVPAGTAVWVKPLIISGKGIKLQGAGTNATILVDENPNNRLGQPSLMDIVWQGTNGGMFELTGFQFKGGINVTSTLITGMIRFKGSNNMTNDSVFRIHGNWWNDPWGRPMQVRAWSGLIDSNTFSLTHHRVGIAFDNRINSSEKGDHSWAMAPPRGTTNLLYFEHNVVSAAGTPRAIIDAFAGARYCVRYNSITNRCVENHGTESTQRTRSGRYMEVYGNTFTQTGSPGEYCLLIRGGSALVFSNNVVGTWPGLLRMIYVLSLQSHGPWRMANGTNVWDLNYAGGPFASGTHNGASGSVDLIDTTKRWTVNQWQKYSVINLSQNFTNRKSVEHMAGLITNNTATSITTRVPNPSFERFTWNNGDVYQIWRLDKGLDAPGRGAGTLLVGGSDSVPPTPTIWPNQIDEPIHLWSNSGTTTKSTAGIYPIVEGRDWTNSVLKGYVPLVDPHPLALSHPVKTAR